MIWRKWFCRENLTSLTFLSLFIYFVRKSNKHNILCIYGNSECKGHTVSSLFHDFVKPFQPCRCHLHMRVAPLHATFQLSFGVSSSSGLKNYILLIIEGFSLDRAFRNFRINFNSTCGRKTTVIFLTNFW